MVIDIKYINEIKDKFTFEKIAEYIKNLKDLKALVIGDTIIDHYLFVAPKGRAIKDPILSVEYKNREVYAGGVLAVTNHVSGYLKEVKLITLIGDENPMLDFIKSSLRKNIELKAFVKENSPTTVKKRMIDFYRNNKLFKIEYINDKPITSSLSEEIVAYLDKELPKYDFIIVADFGHGFINEEIRRKLEEKSKFMALNVQSNSANMGYNYITNYKKSDFVTMNEEELRLPQQMRFEDINLVIKKARDSLKFDNFLVTVGKQGSIFVRNGNLFKAPLLIESVVDTVGAGDAAFAIASLFTYLNADDELIPFIANCAGGIASNVMGHKESITKEKLLNFVKNLYENGME